MTSCKLFHNFWLASALRGIGRPTRGAPPGWPPVWGRRWCLSLIAKRAREGRPQRRRTRARGAVRLVGAESRFREVSRKRNEKAAARAFVVSTKDGTGFSDRLVTCSHLSARKARTHFRTSGWVRRNRSSGDRRLPRRVRWPPRCCPRARSPAPACRARCRGRVSRFQLADRSSRNLRR